MSSLGQDQDQERFALARELLSVLGGGFNRSMQHPWCDRPEEQWPKREGLVLPARQQSHWIPAFAGMTIKGKTIKGKTRESRGCRDSWSCQDSWFRQNS
jgi:hypothetical protein